MLKKYWYAFKQIRFDIFNLERSLVKSFYHLSFKGGEGRYVLMCDGLMKHGGFFDRMKGTISIYALSKVHHKEFKLYFEHPFSLQKYLSPNSYDWTISKDSLNYRYPYAKPIIGYYEFLYPWRIQLKRYGEVHYYFGYNILKKINKKYHQSFNWKQLYTELFQPSEYLRREINKRLNIIGGCYIAVHLRFLNLLGDANESDAKYKALNKEEADKLIMRCIYKIKELLQENPEHTLFLSTDSNVFMQKIKNKLKFYSVEGEIQHIDNVEKNCHDEPLKMFLDYYLLSHATKIFSLVGHGLYRSDFPQYAAIIGGKNIVRIEI